MAIKDKNIELGLNGITKPEPITLPTAQPSSNNLELYGREDTGIPPTQDPSSVYLDEIQKAASEKNYKALLQSDIAAYNLKMNTQKNLNNELAAQGLGTQGYGTSAHVGVENQAQNLYAQNLEGYNQAESDALLAAQDRQSAAGNENDNQLATFLQYSDGSEESIASYMGKYGYTKNNDGVWVDANGNPASAYIQAAAQSAGENAVSPYAGLSASTPQGQKALAWLKGNQSGYSGISSNGYSTPSALAQAVVGRKDNATTGTLRLVVGDEIDAMETWINDNPQTADGTLFRLERGGGAQEAYLVLYVGGRYFIVSDDDREQAGRQVSNRYNNYQGNKVYFKGGKQITK